MRATRICKRCNKRNEEYNFVTGEWKCRKCDKPKPKKFDGWSKGDGPIVATRDRNKNKDYRNHRVWGL
jgi:ribosomal protein L37AE/L43A